MYEKLTKFPKIAYFIFDEEHFPRFFLWGAFWGWRGELASPLKCPSPLLRLSHAYGGSSIGAAEVNAQYRVL